VEQMNNKYVEIFNYLRECPQLSDMWSIAGTEEQGHRVILPQGASSVYQYDEMIDVYGNYQCEIIPYPSIYEDYQINCFAYYDPADSTEPSKNVNVLELEDVQKICDWITAQNDANHLPKITGKKVISVECNPIVPQIRYVNPEENTVGYFITVRIRYVNDAVRKCREFNGD
jgi:hypothetical protein